MGKDFELLTVPEVAKRLKVTEPCIRRWVFERRITTVKLGRLVRVPVQEIDRLIREGLRVARLGSK